MTQEEKDLLLKDLSARLSYMSMVEYKGETYNVLGITHGRLVLCKPFMSYTLDECPLVKEVKPYLFPLSSMTDGQIFLSPFDYSTMDTIRKGKDWSYMEIPHDQYYELVDWFIENHFDYRGLIEQGLAIDATGLNIY